MPYATSPPSTLSTKPWWASFQVIASVVAGTAAIGTGIMVASKYLSLPQRVEATEQKNEAQDKQLDRLITLQEFYQQQRVKELADNGEIKTLDVNGVTFCCDGRDCWLWSKRTKCERHE